MSVWPFPYADRWQGRLTRRHWGGLIAAFAGLHYLSLLVAAWIGNFDPNPNHDHVHVMRDVLETGVPQRAIWPPGFGYYLAGKWLLMQALGLPYWMSKVVVDVWLVVASGVASVELGRLLTRNRFLAACSGLGLVAAPIFLLASAEGLAVMLFQPIFLASLILLVRAVQPPEGSPGAGGPISGLRPWILTALAGAVLGLACLVRANPQFLIFALAPWIFLVQGGTTGSSPKAPPVPPGTGRRLLRTGALVVVFLLAQSLATAPWQSHQRRLGTTGVTSQVFTAPVFFYAFVDGFARHPGNRVSDWVREHRDELPLTLDTVVELNTRWLREDPAALARLYALKSVRTWYLSDSGRWDGAILGLHLPWWLGAVLGLGLWLGRRRSRSAGRAGPGIDPAWIFLVLTVLYMWGVSALVSGLARYMAPVYGLLGLAAGVAVLRGWRAWGDSRGGRAGKGDGGVRASRPPVGRRPGKNRPSGDGVSRTPREALLLGRRAEALQLEAVAGGRELGAVTAGAPANAQTALALDTHRAEVRTADFVAVALHAGDGGPAGVRAGAGDDIAVATVELGTAGASGRGLVRQLGKLQGEGLVVDDLDVLFAHLGATVDGERGAGNEHHGEGERDGQGG